VREGRGGGSLSTKHNQASAGYTFSVDEIAHECKNDAGGSLAR